MPVTSSALAARIAPALAAALEDHKQEILDAAQSYVARIGIKAAWPLILRLVPVLAGVAEDAMRKEWGKLDVNDFLDWIGKAGE